MEVIQSLNFVPMFNLPIDNEFIRKVQRVHALSFLYLERQDVEVHIFVDPIANKILKDIPYHRRTVVSKNYKDRFWAMIKFDALKECPGAIHIDGDVFVKDKKILKKPFNVMVQHKERGWVFEEVYNEQINISEAALFAGFPRLDYTYNCGVLGFSDKEFFGEYVVRMEDLIKKFEANEEVNYLYELHIKEAQPMLIIEQYFLTLLLDQKGIKPTSIISEHSYPEYERIFKTSRGQGVVVDGDKYTHLMGSYKYDIVVQQQIKDKIEAWDPTLHKLIEDE